MSRSGYTSSRLQGRLDTLGEWVAQLGDAEVTAAFKGTHFAESERELSKFGRTVYADADNGTITVFRGFWSLGAADRLSALAHELGHMTATNIEMSRPLGNGDYMFRTSRLLAVEAQANQTAMRIINAGRPGTSMPQLLIGCEMKAIKAEVLVMAMVLLPLLFWLVFFNWVPIEKGISDVNRMAVASIQGGLFVSVAITLLGVFIALNRLMQKRILPVIALLCILVGSGFLYWAVPLVVAVAF